MIKSLGFLPADKFNLKIYYFNVFEMMFQDFCKLAFSCYPETVSR
jgi:hypothetical protein